MKLFRNTLLLVLLPMFPAVRAQSSPVSFSGLKTATIYVSAANGNDSWSGRLPWPNGSRTDGPLATFEQARKTVLSVNKTGLSEVRVQFREGVYYLGATETLTQADSGTAQTQIVYENFPGEYPVFSGGRRVTNWTRASGNMWTAPLPAGALYFEDLFYNGVRHPRPRLGGYLGTYYRMSTVYVDDTEAAKSENQNCSIYVEGKGWECFDRFAYDSTTPISSSWKNLNPPPGANSHCDPSTGSIAPVGDIAVLDFEQFSVSKLLVSCVDTQHAIVYMTGPTPMPAKHATEVGFIQDHRYLVENVEDALTQPGQWFLDRSTYPWVVKYLAGSAFENPNYDTVIIPQLPQILLASNLRYVTFRGLTFEHGNFTVPAPLGYVSNELEPNIGATVSIQNSQFITFDSSVVTHTSGVGLDIISCNQSGSPSWCLAGSINPNAVTANIVVKNSAFFDLGVHGVRVGVPGLPQDSDANVPYSITIENNVIEGYGRVIPSAFGIGSGVGHDNLFTHNDVYDGYHCAISISENLPDNVAPGGHGDFNNTISFNHVFNLLQGIMNDGGSIRIQGGNSVSDAVGNKILNNKIHDVTDASIQDPDGYGGHGIYLDNQTGQVDVENNLVYRVSASGIYAAHGPAKHGEASTITNNIFAFARASMVQEGFPYENGDWGAQAHRSMILSNNIFYFDRNENSPLQPFRVQAGCTYADMFAYSDYQDFTSNLYWRTDGTFASEPHAFHQQLAPSGPNVPNAPCSASKSDWTFYLFSQWMTQAGEDAHSIIQNPGFLFPVYPLDIYWMPKGSPGAGFVPFDPNEAGRTFPKFIPPPVAPGFPTMHFNPVTDY